MDKNKDILRGESIDGGFKWSGPLAASFLIIILALIIYLPSVNAPFVLDDDLNITNNLRLHDLSSFWPPAGSRYLAYLSFAINYRLGGLNPLGYHLVNITLHILSALTLYGLVRTLFRAPLLIECGYNEVGAQGIDTRIALIAALIFTVHPINTQAVIYVTQRFAGLVSLLYLLSLYLYLKWRIGGISRRPSSYTAIFYILSIFSALAAAKTKEISFTLPFIILFTEYVFFTEQGRWISPRRLLSLLPYVLVLIVIPLSILGPEFGFWSSGAVMDDGITRVQMVSQLKSLSPYAYLLTQFTVVPHYIRLFFVPLSQNLDYDWPLYTSFFNIKVIAGGFFLLLIFILALLTAYFARRGKRPLLLLGAAGVLWFFITLSIESTIIPLSDVIFEHRMYLPGAGLSLTVAVLVVYLVNVWSAGGARRSLIIAVCIIIAALSALALRRSFIWSDGIRLYEDILQKSPHKARPHNNLGLFYVEAGKLDKALAEFREALALDEDYPPSHLNIAKILRERRDLKGSIEEYKAVIRVYPAYYAAHEGLALTYSSMGLLEKSETEYKIVLTLMPSNVDARMNLANIYVVEGRFGEAIAEFKRILRGNPRRVGVYFNLAVALEKMGSTDEARYYYKKFIELAPARLGKFKQDAQVRVERLNLNKK